MTAIVTGASRGIGAAIARLLGASGYSVAVNYAQDEVGAAGGERNCPGGGGASRRIACRGCFRLFEQTERELGPVTALVNNAGVTGGISRVADVGAAGRVDGL